MRCFRVSVNKRGRIMKRIAVLCCVLLAVSIPVFARGGGGYSFDRASSHYSSKSHSTTSKHSSRGSHLGQHHSNYANGVARDKNGHIARSEHAKNEFKKSHPCPSTGKSSGSCPGYVIDHIKPLKRGGVDDPSNMQWQTKEAAKAKDKVE